MLISPFFKLSWYYFNQVSLWKFEKYKDFRLCMSRQYSMPLRNSRSIPSIRSVPRPTAAGYRLQAAGFGVKSLGRRAGPHRGRIRGGNIAILEVTL
jgi:hypothetical protein